MTLPEAESVAARFVDRGWAARTYPSDRQNGAHMVVVRFGKSGYHVYETAEEGRAFADFASGVYSHREEEEGGINGTASIV